MTTSAQIDTAAFQPIIYHLGRRFYSLLVKKHDDPNRICLYGSNDYVDGDFVVACDNPNFRPNPNNPNKTKSSIFTSFRTYTHFFEFFVRLPLEHRTFYEVIPHDKQKPHFDADIEFKDGDPNIGKYSLVELGSLMKLSLQSAIDDVMRQYNVDYDRDRHMIWTDSSTNVKQSFHVIINGYYHNDNIEAKAFYELVKVRLHPTIRDYLDKAVYGSNQQFRLINNHKIAKNNTKVLDTTITKWRPTDCSITDKVYNLRIFEASMVSFTGDSVVLPSFLPATSITAATIKKRPDDQTVDYSIYENQIRSLYESSSVSASGKIRDFNGKYININSSHRFRCPICDKVHHNENPRLTFSKGSLYWDCRRRNDNSLPFFIGRIEGYINPEHYDPDDEKQVVEDDTVNEELTGDLFGISESSFDKSKSFAENVICHRENAPISVIGDNKLKDDLSLMTQHGSTVPIIDGNNQITNQSSSVHKGHWESVPPRSSMIPLYKIQRNNYNVGGTASHLVGQTEFVGSITSDYPYVNEPSETLDDNAKIDINNNYDGGTASHLLGQIHPPCSTTTIESYLLGNIKYIGCHEYHVKEIYDSYNEYRGNFGTCPNYERGHFSKALTKLGHTVTKKRLNGTPPAAVVLLKRSEPIVNTTTNPVEAVKAVQQAIANKPNIKPQTPTVPEGAQQGDEISPQLEQPTHATEPEKVISKDFRLLNPHEDIPAFRDIYLTIDPEAETDLDNLHLSFVDYCEKNKIRLVRFGRGRLINFFKKWLITREDNEQSIDAFVLKGWRIKEDKEEINNAEKERRLRKIWHFNTAPYHIGWHNGRDNERYDKTRTKQWKKIDVHHCYDSNIRNIPQLIEMTQAFEKSLPTRVKDIKQRIFNVQFSPLASDDMTNITKECDNLKVLCSNSLVSGIFTDGSPEHEIFKTRIDELTNRYNEARDEAIRVMNEEVARLEASINDDLERLRREASWCCAVRSTFASGKTVNLKPYIEAFPDMKVLIVLPRKTLTDEFIREYRALGFEIYLDTPKGNITGNRIIVCYPSISRVIGTFDLYVADEYKSLHDLQHTLVASHSRRSKGRTGKSRSKELACYTAMKHFVANTQRVYIADALLTNAHVLEIARMRSKSEDFNRRVTVYQNLFPKHRGKKVFTVNNQDLTAHTILKCLREGKRVVLADNSKVFAEFVNKKILESDLNITTSLITADQRATDTLDIEWSDTRFISYSPTILSGNSYTDAVDVIFGYFTTSSCDQADALQMLMRCRNVTSNEYYICVEQGPRRTPIPEHVYQAFEPIKQYMLDLSKSSRSKIEMTGWPEEFQLPINIVPHDPAKDCIKENHPYFISRINHTKQCVVAEREYLFRMLLYMRDCGFEYGGNIYTKTADKPHVAHIKLEKKEYKKDRVQANYEGKSTCNDLTKDEYEEISKKTIKTKEEKNQCYKYIIKRKYQVENVPIWFLKATSGKGKQHSNITKYQSVNGVIDQKQRYELMKKIRDHVLPPDNNITTNNHIRDDVPPVINNNTLTAELLQGDKSYNVLEDMETTWTSQDLKLCEHSLNILKIIGAETFIRDIPRFDIQYVSFNINQYKDYISQNEKELRTLVNDFKIQVDNLASKVTNKAFGIKIIATPTGHTINSIWVMNQNNMIWPYNRDGEEELRVRPPDPTVDDKAKTWINNKILQMNTNTDSSKLCIRAPQQRACVNEKLLQVTPQPKVEPAVVVQRRVPAVAIQYKGVFLVNPK